MKVVVVGGQARKVGKTSVIAGLIRGLSTLAWTAVKISYHDGDADLQDAPSEDDLPVSATIRDVGPGFAPPQAAPRGGPTNNLGHYDLPAPGGATRRVAPTPTIDLGHEGLPAHLDFLLSEEVDCAGHGDTSLYLAAGARRALWLRVRGGRLAQAMPELLEALKGAEHAIIESNSLLAFLKPAIFLFVMDESRGELKASAKQFIGRADALVTVGAEVRTPVWPVIPGQMLEGKPVFPVLAGEWSSPALTRFVCERLALAEG
jgi:hypothetical protein